MKYIATVLLLIGSAEEHQQADPAIVLGFVFLLIFGAVGWALYVLSAMKVKQLKGEMAAVHAEVMELRREHDENLQKIRALESDLRHATSAIDQLTKGMARIDKMFKDDSDETLS